MTTAVLEETPTAALSKSTLMLPLPKLQQALATVTLAVQRKTTIPVLCSVEIAEHDGYVDFSGTNLDLAVRYRAILPEAKQRRPFLMPGLKLETFAKLLQGETVKITCHDDRKATLTCGRSTTRVPLQSSASFPKIAVSDGVTGIGLARDVMARMLDFTSFAISTEESRYMLACALLEVAGGKLSLVATDGHRLARYTVPTDEADRFPMLLPHGMVRAVEKVLSGGTFPLMLNGDDQNVYASTLGDGFAVALGHRRITGQFPNYRAAMPTGTACTVTVDAETMFHALRRCATFSADNQGALKLTVTSDSIKLRGAAQYTGETDEYIDAAVVGEFEMFTTGFKDVYLMDAFSRLKGDVEIRFAGANNTSAALIVAEPADGELFEYVVMPMRV